jgi:hypothetical protein
MSSQRVTRQGNSRYSYYLRQAQWEEDFRDCCERGDLTGLQTWVEEFLQPRPVQEIIQELQQHQLSRIEEEDFPSNFEESPSSSAVVTSVGRETQPANDEQHEQPSEGSSSPLPLIDESIKSKLSLTFPVTAFDQSTSMSVEYEWCTREPRFQIVLPLKPYLPIDVNASREEDGRNALILAGVNGHLPVVRYLVETVGVEVNRQDKVSY